MSSDPWGNASTAQENKESSVDWMQADTPMSDTDGTHFDILHPFDYSIIPFDDWTNQGIDWLVQNFRDFFLAAKTPIDIVLSAIESFLMFLNPYVVIIFFVLLALQFSTKNLLLEH